MPKICWRVVEGEEQPDVSILYWRCTEGLEVWLHWDSFRFQFSIGDAVIHGLVPTPEANALGFNSLLEMQLYSSWHDAHASFAMFQFSIGDASLAEKEPLHESYWVCFNSLLEMHVPQTLRRCA